MEALKCIDSNNEITDFDPMVSVVIKDNNVYKMWYSKKVRELYRIFYATSDDGILWKLKDEALDLKSMDGGLHHTNYNPSVIKDDDIYKMWFTYNNYKNDIIRYAHSTNGIDWTVGGVVVDLGNDTDKVHVNSPCVIKDGDTYKMWYTGHDGINERAHYATSSDGITWDKHGVVKLSQLDDNENYEHMEPTTVIKDGDTYKMWYNYFKDDNWYTSYAISNDGKKWKEEIFTLKYAVNTTELRVTMLRVIKDDDTYKIWCISYDKHSRRTFFNDATK